MNFGEVSVGKASPGRARWGSAVLRFYKLLAQFLKVAGPWWFGRKSMDRIKKGCASSILSFAVSCRAKIAIVWFLILATSGARTPRRQIYLSLLVHRWCLGLKCGKYKVGVQIRPYRKVLKWPPRVSRWPDQGPTFKGEGRFSMGLSSISTHGFMLPGSVSNGSCPRWIMCCRYVRLCGIKKGIICLQAPSITLWQTLEIICHREILRHTCDRCFPSFYKQHHL